MNLADQIITRAHYVERYKTYLFDGIKPFLKRIEKHLLDQLVEAKNPDRIKAKLKTVQTLIEQELNDYTLLIMNEIDGFIAQEIAFNAMILDIADSALPSLNRARAAVYLRPFNNAMLRDELKAFSKEHAKMIRDAINIGYFESKTVKEIVYDIVGLRIYEYKDGVLNVTRTAAARMVRTAINHIQAVTKDQVYQDAGIKFYEWVSTMDSRTSITCAALDGMIFRVGKGKLPPSHYNCRSVTAPLLPEEVKMVNGKPTKVKPEETYSSWLKRQPAKFQDDVLGKERAELFRSGKLEIRQFVDSKFRPLSLAELGAKFNLDPED